MRKNIPLIKTPELNKRTLFCWTGRYIFVSQFRKLQREKFWGALPTLYRSQKFKNV